MPKATAGRLFGGPNHRYRDAYYGETYGPPGPERVPGTIFLPGGAMRTTSGRKWYYPPVSPTLLGEEGAPYLLSYYGEDPNGDRSVGRVQPAAWGRKGSVLRPPRYVTVGTAPNAPPTTYYPDNFAIAAGVVDALPGYGLLVYAGVAWGASPPLPKFGSEPLDPTSFLGGSVLAVVIDPADAFPDGVDAAYKRSRMVLYPGVFYEPSPGAGGGYYSPFNTDAEWIAATVAAVEAFYRPLAG